MRAKEAAKRWMAARLISGVLLAALMPHRVDAQTVVQLPTNAAAALPRPLPLLVPSPVPTMPDTERADVAAALKKAAIAGATRAVITLQARAATLRSIAQRLREGSASQGDLAHIVEWAGAAAGARATHNPSTAAANVEGTAAAALREADEVQASIVHGSQGTAATVLRLLQNPAVHTKIYTFQPVPAGAAPGALGPQIAVMQGYGGPTTNFANVGLLIFESPGQPEMYCSGTLVRPDKVLTAAHCFCPWREGNPPETAQRCQAAPEQWAYASQWHVYFHFAGLVDIKSVGVDSAYRMSSSGSSDDLAVAQLSNPIDVPPGTIGSGLAHMIGESSEVVGFGWSYLGKAGPSVGAFPVNALVQPGMKVMAAGLVTRCPSGFTGVCWNAGPRSTLTGATCDGDSGGPVMLSRTQPLLVGVTSLGNTSSCSTRGPQVGTVGTNLELQASATFLKAALGPVGNSTRPFSVIANLAVEPLSASGLFTDTVSTAAPFRALIVAANAPYESALNLQVVPASRSSPACVPTINTHFQNEASCVIHEAPAGQYAIKVTGLSNELIQLTAAGFN